ncbi:MAG: N-methyl-L-tryptophan oxidase [Cyclobacteriaceae bacterium]
MKRREFINKSIGGTVLASTLPLSQLFAHVNEVASKSVTQDSNYDVIVLGVGSMGSSTCYHLAKQGQKVLGLEQFDIPHELGSYAGQSRIIRKAYFEHPDYVPLLERAYQNWKSLENETGAELYYKTGLLYYGKSDHALIKGLWESANKYAIPINEITADEQTAQFPQFKIPDDYEQLIEPDAGFVTPERAVLLYTERAIQSGASIHTKEKTLEWKRNGSVITVKTDKKTYQCKKLIITAGPWAGEIVTGLSNNLKVTRQMIAWVKPKNWKKFELGNFPCWTIADHERPGIYYGFPILPTASFGGPIGMKLAHHYHGDVTHPNKVDRNPTAEDESNLIQMLNKFMPEGYESTHVMKTCLYTNTPDENFILDFVPGQDKDVIIAAGFSGHGFKFASVVGEIMADLTARGSTTQPIGFLNAKRFS